MAWLVRASLLFLQTSGVYNSTYTYYPTDQILHRYMLSLILAASSRLLGLSKSGGPFGMSTIWSPPLKWLKPELLHSVYELLHSVYVYIYIYVYVYVAI